MGLFNTRSFVIPHGRELDSLEQGKTISGLRREEVFEVARFVVCSGEQTTLGKKSS